MSTGQSLVRPGRLHKTITIEGLTSHHPQAYMVAIVFSTFFPFLQKKCYCLLSKIAKVFCCSISKRLTEHTLKCCCLCLLATVSILATVCYFITFWPRLQSLPTLVHAEKFACFEFVALKSI